jgi:hypothetical protein
METFVCCQYCKAAFRSKDELYSHWFKTCHKYCPCANCQFPVYVQTNFMNQMFVYFNKSNLHVSVMEAVQRSFPNLFTPNAVVNSDVPFKRIKLDTVVDMEVD